MSQKFTSGDSVTWSAGGGEAEGTVKKKITDDKKVDGQQVNASKNDPRYLVENDNTGNTTGHKPDALSDASAGSSSAGSSSSGSSSSGSSSSGSASSSSTNKFSKGDKVEWNTSQGSTTGTVKKKLTSDTSIKDYDVKASKDNPKYLVESESSGAEAAHKPGSLESA